MARIDNPSAKLERRNDDRFQRLVDGVTDYAILMLDAEGRVKTWNIGAERIKGFAAEEIIGEHFSRFYPAEDVASGKPARELATALREGRCEDEGWRVRKDGSRFWANSIITPLCDEAGHHEGFARITRDITSRRRAEETLRASEERFRTMAETIPTLVTIFQGTGHVYVNAAAESMLGYPREELLQRSFLDYVHPDFREIVLERSLARQRGDIVIPRYEIRIVTKSGRDLWVDFAAALVEYDGKPAVLGIASDITTKKQIDAALRESEERFRNAFDHALNGMYICGLEGEWLRVNEALCRILGRPREELLGMTGKAVTHPDDQEQDLVNARRLLAGEISYYHAEKRYLRKDAQVVWVLVGGSVVRDPQGNPLYFVGHVQDVTEQKQTQEPLKRYAEALSRSNADLQQFASAASHDLQAPLRGVAGLCRLLEKTYQDRFDEQGKNWLRLLIQDAKNMDDLVRGLLRFSRVDTEGKPFDSTDSGAAVDRALAHLRSELEETLGQVTRAVLPVIPADADQLTDVFQNLIGNALKYRGNRPPRVHIAAVRKPREWLFSVRDNGIGIDPKYYEHVFVMFQRLHLPEEYPGAGIGLTLCKRIVERHGGRIWVEAPHDGGSQFCFTIPTRESR